MKTTKNKFEACIKIFGRTYKATGDTLIEALTNLKVSGKAGGTSILSISYGDNKRDRILNTSQVYRLFSPSRLIRETAIKNLSLLFNL